MLPTLGWEESVQMWYVLVKPVKQFTFKLKNVKKASTYNSTPKRSKNNKDIINVHG